MLRDLVSKHPDVLPPKLSSHSFRATTMTDLRQAGINNMCYSLRISLTPKSDNPGKPIVKNTNFTIEQKTMTS